jgi:hypothetical protein
VVNEKEGGAEMVTGDEALREMIVVAEVAIARRLMEEDAWEMLEVEITTLKEKRNGRANDLT